MDNLHKHVEKVNQENYGQRNSPAIQKYLDKMEGMKQEVQERIERHDNQRY